MRPLIKLIHKCRYIPLQYYSRQSNPIRHRTSLTTSPSDPSGTPLPHYTDPSSTLHKSSKHPHTDTPPPPHYTDPAHKPTPPDTPAPADNSHPPESPPPRTHPPASAPRPATATPAPRSACSLAPRPSPSAASAPRQTGRRASQTGWSSCPRGVGRRRRRRGAVARTDRCSRGSCRGRRVCGRCGRGRRRGGRGRRKGIRGRPGECRDTSGEIC